jgi:hypothetical protein
MYFRFYHEKVRKSLKLFFQAEITSGADFRITLFDIRTLLLRRYRHYQTKEILSQKRYFVKFSSIKTYVVLCLHQCPIYNSCMYEITSACLRMSCLLRMTSLRCLRIGAVLSKYLLTDMDLICGVSVCEMLFRYCMKRKHYTI